MKISYFIEYLIIGALYLIPYFVIHYTIVCYKLEQRMGLIESIVFAYKKLPEYLKGTLPLEIKNPRIPILLFLFFLTIIGSISNGILIHADGVWLKGLRRVTPHIYESSAETPPYVKNIKAIFKYGKNECGDLLGKIQYQIIITRHGLAHSLIFVMCLPFILACNKLNMTAKFFWLSAIFISFILSAYGFITTNKWYEGVLNTILSIE
jgi:hypothetical protein